MTKVKTTKGTNVRISDEAHKKIKVYCANNDLVMGEFVAQASLEKIKAKKK